MKQTLLAIGAIILYTASVSTFAASASSRPSAYWLETSASTLDASMGGDGIRDTKVWHSTISSVLIRHPKGDVLIDTGFGRSAEAQMSELPANERDFGLQIVSGAKDRTPIVDALETVGETPDKVARILITHAHYDHLGGAAELKSPTYVAPAEATWLAGQAKQPTITPPSLVAAIMPRLRSLPYNSGPYLGFDSSHDVYGDGTIVVVPLPGHTPGSQGVFIRLGSRRVFLLGDAADTLEAADRGLPKNAVIRAATDYDPQQADATTKRISDFHRAHPEIALVPAHDRDAYVAVFGRPSTPISSFPAPQADTQGSKH